MISHRNRREKSELATSVDSLRDEVRVLREVLDEIRDALEWQNNNAADFPALGDRPAAAWSLAEVSLPVADSCDETHDAAASIPHACPTMQRNLF